MKIFFILVLCFLFLTSCQTSEPADNLRESKPKKEDIVASQKNETIPDKSVVKPEGSSRKSMTLPIAIQSPKAKNISEPGSVARSLPPNTISNCPAGLNGALVGQIEKGRHCFTNTPVEASKCLGQNDNQVRKKAESYCKKLKNHWIRTGVWRYGPELNLKIDNLKRFSCQCGVWRGELLCKSFFTFECRTIRFTTTL